VGVASLKSGGSVSPVAGLTARKARPPAAERSGPSEVEREYGVAIQQKVHAVVNESGIVGALANAIVEILEGKLGYVP